mmetsp:Transcript_21769/g.55629  ORF Transcript_21769/g.55629 Transcript_21769/m.55629 type:complete len:217 (-) Transcript_21769:458-1108(-)
MEQLTSTSVTAPMGIEAGIILTATCSSSGACSEVPPGGHPDPAGPAEVSGSCANAGWTGSKFTPLIFFLSPSSNSTRYLPAAWSNSTIVASLPLRWAAPVKPMTCTLAPEVSLSSSSTGGGGGLTMSASRKPRRSIAILAASPHLGIMTQYPCSRLVSVRSTCSRRLETTSATSRLHSVSIASSSSEAFCNLTWFRWSFSERPPLAWVCKLDTFSL